MENSKIKNFNISSQFIVAILFNNKNINLLTIEKTLLKAKEDSKAYNILSSEIFKEDIK